MPLSFPLRIPARGGLRIEDYRTALVTLIEGIMVRCVHGSWRGSRHFGLADYLEDASTKPHRLFEAVEEVNKALAELGIPERLAEIRRESRQDESLRGTERFLFILTSGERLSPPKSSGGEHGISAANGR